MTNGEKFKEVFGFNLEEKGCIMRTEDCEHFKCDSCGFNGWKDRTFNPYLQFKNEYDDGK